MSRHHPARGCSMGGMCLLIACAMAGCTKLAPVRVAPPAAARLDTRPGDDLQRFVAETAARARQHLQTDTVLETLRHHRRWVDAAKWSTVGLSAGTTILGTIGSTQDPEEKWLTYSTAAVGAATTVFTAVRSDADVARRIAACEQVARDGNIAIDTYVITWSGRVLTAPPPTQPEAFKKFVEELVTASTAMMTAVNGMMVNCY